MEMEDIKWKHFNLHQLMSISSHLIFADVAKVKESMSHMDRAKPEMLHLLSGKPEEGSISAEL